MSKTQTTTNEATIRKMEVFYKWQETSTGKKFKKWLTKTADGKIYQVSFVREALQNMPSASATIYVKETDLNLNKKNPKYPVFYVNSIEKVEQHESSVEDFDKYFEKA